jgi:hypothetical protein
MAASYDSSCQEALEGSKRRRTVKALDAQGRHHGGFDVARAHEWCMYGRKPGAAHRFFGPPNVPDLWHVKRVSPNKMIHLTEKPVELARRAIE